MLIFNSDKQFFTSTLLKSDNIVHGFGTKKLGDGKDIKNISFEKIAKPLQVHGDHIEVVENFEGKLKTYPETDGLITKERGVTLIVLTADCLPIVYSDEKAGIIGISHQGWKGTELKLVQKMIKRFLDLRSTLYDLRIAIGPGIGACCYHRNLTKENFDILVETGIKPDQIDYFPFCTSCDEERFFSYRKVGKPKDFPEQFSFVLMKD